MDFLDSECAARSHGPGNNLLSTLLTAVITIHCNISNSVEWPDDYGPRAVTDGLEPYDFIVIGGGTSGSVVASRLSENPKYRVLLLEAGSDPTIESEIPSLSYKIFNTDGDWAYPTESNRLSCMGMKNESCVWHRGKMLGGSSATGPMLYYQGVSRDYDYWEHKGDTLWSWRDVFPYFKKFENFRGNDVFKVHGKGGPVNVEAFWSPKHDQNLILQAAQELGHPYVQDFVHEHYLGFGWFYGFVKDGWRESTAKAYLTGDVGLRSNLHVIKDAVATKIGFGKNNKATSVNVVIDGEHTMEAQAKREIIVSAGAIESAKLLMLSGLGPKTHLKSVDVSVLKDLPVGENLMDHARVDIFAKFDYKDPSAPEIRKVDAIYNQLVHRFGSLGSPTLDVGGFINTRNSSRYPDIQFAFIPVPDLEEYAANYKEYIRRSLDKQVKPSDHVIVFSVILLRPKSSGFVRLNSNDYREKPMIIPNTFQKDADSETIIRGIRELLKFEDSETFRKFRGKFLKLNIPACNNEKYRSWKYWQCYVKYMSNSFFEPAGTARMGPDTDAGSVVDNELRVRGVRGLRVIDSSVMPSMISGPITGPTIMIGEKGADFILEGWKNFD